MSYEINFINKYNLSRKDKKMKLYRMTFGLLKGHRY